jgi:hypothetical protein
LLLPVLLPLQYALNGPAARPGVHDNDPNAEIVPPYDIKQEPLQRMGKLEIGDPLVQLNGSTSNGGPGGPLGELLLANGLSTRGDAVNDKLAWLFVNLDEPTAKDERTYAVQIAVHCGSGGVSVVQSEWLAVHWELSEHPDGLRGDLYGFPTRSQIHTPYLVVDKLNKPLVSAVRAICEP